MARIASFHLVRRKHAVTALASLALDRRRLAATPGLEFWRLMGTGAGRSTGPGIDTRRTALFAVWRDESDLDAFVDGPSASARPDVVEAWHTRLRLVGGHGTWRGSNPLAGLARASAGSGAIAVLTRATVRPRAWREFRHASRAVDDELQRMPGLLDAVAIGEAPVGRLGTFSLWRSDDAMRSFATEAPRHRDVVGTTRRDHWYRDELFARFEPYGSFGTWDGRDPLAHSAGS